MNLETNFQIPYLDLKGRGNLLHFAHANGYPPECYKPLLSVLSSQYHVLSLYQRPLWSSQEPGSINSWHPLTDDLLLFMDQQAISEAVAVGHSMGGIASLRAVLREPERFKALILLDPVLFPPYFIRFWQLVRFLKLEYRIHPLIPGTYRRRRTFTSREQLFSLFRRKNIFQYFSDSELQALVAGLTKRENGKFHLTYSPEWEARIYATAAWADMDLWRGLSTIQIPLLILRGIETDTFWESTARLVLKKNRTAKIITIDSATHLVPLERPNEVASLILTFLEEHL